MKHLGPGRRPLLWAWLATFSLFLAVAHGNLETTDTGITMLAARNLWMRGDSGILRADQGAESIAEAQAAAFVHAGGSGKVGTNGIAYTWFPVGHVWLLVPFVAVGEALERALPTVGQRFRERIAPGEPPAQQAHRIEAIQGQPVIVQGLIAGLLPPACAASILVLLFLLARQLGANGRDAALTAVAILFASQGFAFGRESLSDGPGLVFLLGALLAAVAVHQGRGSPWTSSFGGVAAGCAVLLRYQNAALLLAIGAALLLACRRQGRWRDLLAFGTGVLPAAVLLLAVNQARFGSPFDTGYPKVDDWLDQPMWLGVLKILFGAGRGVAWFSPLVWLALPAAWSRRHTVRWRWLAWLLFLFPLCFFALARGWQGGQCWAARYVTHGLVLLLALTLPQTLPWRRWPRSWLLLLTLGGLVNLTSVVAPVRGVLQLGSQAVAAATGSAADAADIAGWHPRYTPLRANWRYALASRVGGFEHANGSPRHGSAHTVEALFGVAAANDEQALAPIRWEDRCGRHLWWRFWGDVLAVPWWLLLGPTVGLCLSCLLRLWVVLRSRQASDSSTAR